jgi:peptide/nickel transport system ATP-binding protein
MDTPDIPLLSVRNLQTYFKLDEGTVKAVDGVSFDVYSGQVVGIVGESGCGKSVTIKSVLRIVPKPGACLLYTSPSPRDRQKSRMPSSA